MQENTETQCIRSVTLSQNAHLDFLNNSVKNKPISIVLLYSVFRIFNT